MKTTKRISALLLIFFLLFYQSVPVYAHHPRDNEEENESQTSPAISEIPREPENVIPTISSESIEMPIPESITPTPATIEPTLATQEASFESTPEADIPMPTISLPIETSAESAITTGDINEEVHAATEVNTNIVGTNNCFVVLNLFENPNSPVDLSSIVPTDCHNATESTPSAGLHIQNTNVATIQQNIALSANTGGNIIEGTNGQITTGDATAAAYVSNVANTNIVGSNTLYGVINIFKPTSQNIILPYELAFTNAMGQTDTLPISTIGNKNSALVKNTITAETTTGNNEGDNIETGNGTILVRESDVANTNILNSGFFILDINTLGAWNGRLLGGTMNFPKSYDPVLKADTIENGNQATVENNILLQANTGNNKATGDNSTIQTGNSTTKAFISNIANTNIVGNNWYHLAVNIFDTFDGDIILPRPDLATASSVVATGNNEVVVTIRYGNLGTLWAKDAQILTHLPENAKILAYSDGAQFDGSRIYWNIGTVEKQQGGSRSVKIFLPDPGTYYVTSSISTSTDEPNKTNNSSQVTIDVAPNIIPTPIVYNQRIVRPVRRFLQRPIYQQQPVLQKQQIVYKLATNQLRTTQGEVLAANTNNQKSQTANAFDSNFAHLFIIYVFSAVLGVFKLFRP
ncbi:hypothetical protein BH09PAT1_BH09PAT1_1630 [soil metagenome]